MAMMAMTTSSSISVKPKAGRRRTNSVGATPNSRFRFLNGNP
jgi:hypothetical protein